MEKGIIEIIEEQDKEIANLKERVKVLEAKVPGVHTITIDGSEVAKAIDKALKDWLKEIEVEVCK